MKLIQIFKRNKCIDYAIIDDYVYENVRHSKWHVKKNRIVNENGLLLHHVIFSEKNHKRCYTMTFKDGNPLNYQKDNVIFSHKKIAKQNI